MSQSMHIASVQTGAPHRTICSGCGKLEIDQASLIRVHPPCGHITYRHLGCAFTSCRFGCNDILAEETPIEPIRPMSERDLRRAHKVLQMEKFEARELEDNLNAFCAITGDPFEEDDDWEEVPDAPPNAYRLMFRRLQEITDFVAPQMMKAFA